MVHNYKNLWVFRMRKRLNCYCNGALLKHRNHRKGFTLVELIVVIVILAIAAAVAIPMLTNAGSIQLTSAASLIAADLEYAKSMAITTGLVYSVVFNNETERYQLEDQNGSVIPHPVKKGFDYVVDFRNNSRLDKVNIVSADFDGTSEIRFDYIGSPQNGNGTALTSGTITLQANSDTVTVIVEPVTGYISVP